MESICCKYHKTKKPVYICIKCGFLCVLSEEPNPEHAPIAFDENLYNYYNSMIITYNARLHLMYYKLLLASCTTQFQNHNTCTNFLAFQLIRQTFLNSRSPSEFRKFIRGFIEKEIIWMSQLVNDRTVVMQKMKAKIKIKCVDKISEIFEKNINLSLCSKIELCMEFPDYICRISEILLIRQIIIFEYVVIERASCEYEYYVHTSLKKFVLFNKKATYFYLNKAFQITNPSLEKAEAYLLLFATSTKDQKRGLVVQMVNIFSIYQKYFTKKYMLILLTNCLFSIVNSWDRKHKIKFDDYDNVSFLEGLHYVNHNLLFKQYFEKGMEYNYFENYHYACCKFIEAYKQMVYDNTQLWPYNNGAVLYFYLIYTSYFGDYSCVVEYSDEFIAYLKHLHPLKLDHVGFIIFYTLIIAALGYYYYFHELKAEYCMRLIIKLMDTADDYTFLFRLPTHTFKRIHKNIIKEEVSYKEYYEKKGNLLSSSRISLALGCLYRMQGRGNLAQNEYRSALINFIQLSQNREICLAFEFLISMNKREKLNTLDILMEYKNYVAQLPSPQNYIVNKLNKIIKDE